MKIKKMLSCLLCFVLICSLSLSFSVSAYLSEEEIFYNQWGDKSVHFITTPDGDGFTVFEHNDFKYFYDKTYLGNDRIDYTMYIYDYTGTDTTVYIPNEIHGWPVKGVYRLEADFRVLEEVIIPSNVEHIYEFCFKNVKKVTFSENSKLSRIEREAFQGNYELKSINLPESLEFIGSYAFSSCEALKEIVIPEKCTKFGPGAFKGCTSLEKITFLGNEIHEYADDYDYFLRNDNKISSNFAYGCTSLKSIKLPETTKFIGAGAFQNSGLTSITIPKNVKTIYKKAFYGCKNLTSVKFAGAVNNIGRSAFSRCVNLKSVNFTKGYLKKLYDYAFYKCEKLDKITISNTKNVPSIHKSAFNKAKSGIKFYVKNNTVAKKLKSKLQKTNIKKAKIYRSAPILLYKNVG